MIDPSNIAGDVIAAATALAGLILVYLGGIANGYARYDTTQRHAVKSSYQKRAWFAFVGFVLAILSAGLALIGVWFDIDCLTALAAVILGVSLAWGVVTALLTVLEIS